MYNNFIEGILNSRPNERFEGAERHHILPKCMGGKDEADNLVFLTPREHFLAHKMLAEENPHNRGLQFGWWKMCQGRNCYTAEEYEQAKQNMLHQPKSESFKAKLSEANKINKKGNTNFLGKHHSEETKRKISQAKKGTHHEVSAETREKISKTNKGRVGGMQGKKHSEETKAKMREKALIREALKRERRTQ